MKKILAVCLAVFMLSSTAFAAAPDIKGNAYEKEITELYGFGILGGFDDGTFRPENTFTRAEFSKIICKVLKIEDPSDTQNIFDDCKGHWAEKYINQCYEKGIINGVTPVTIPESVYFVDLDENGNPVGIEAGTYLPYAAERTEPGYVKPEMRFAPDRALKMDEALKIAVCLLGHAGVDNSLAYPEGYRSKAKELKLASDNEDFEGYISRGRAAKLVSDALRIPTLKASVGEDGNSTVYNIGNALIDSFK